MEKFAKKGMAALVGLALISAAGLAQAVETRFAVQDAGGTDKMSITDSGYLGVGTWAPNTFPNYPIHVKLPSAAAMYFHSTGRAAVAPGDSANLYLMRNNDAAVNSGLPRVNDRLGMLQFGSLVPGVGNVFSAGMATYAEGADWTTASAPTSMIFFTTPANQTGSYERLRISSTGNVGIGSSSAQLPTQRLEVNGGVRLRTTTARPACDVNVRGTLWFQQQSAVGVADTLAVCSKDVNGNYAWNTLLQ